MSSVLREGWLKRLDAAQLDPSWSAPLEVRVLRFLLSRHEGAAGESPVPVQPFYEGEAPHGRAKMPLSPRAQRGRLEHTAVTTRDSWPLEEPTLLTSWELAMQKRDEEAIVRHRRYQTRRERGYW